MIKAITFDLDGVYFVNGKSNFIKNLKELGVSKDEAKRVFLQSDQMNKEYKEGKMTDDEYWSWASKEWSLDLPPKELIDLMIRDYKVDEEVVKVVKQARESGYKTLICSNNFPSRINGLDKKFGFLSNFDGVALSYKVGVTKPDRKIFDELVKLSEVDAEEIVFADDNEDNISGAKEVGIEAFFYDGFEKFIQKLEKLGVNLSTK